MYGAEFGGKASALINVVTRAGSNTVRGSLFGFRRDDALDAPNYFQPAGQEPPPLRQDQFGGTLGGPLVRNRTFVFGSFEGLRMQRSLTRTFSVPSAAVRAGDFGGLGTICDPLDHPDRRHVHPVRRQSHPGRPHRSDCRGAPGARAAPDERRQPAEPGGRRGAGSGSGSAERPVRSSADLGRPGARPIQHLRCARTAAVRYQRAAGNARAGLWTVADHADAQRGRQPHADVREVGGERSARQLAVGVRRADQ